MRWAARSTAARRSGRRTYGPSRREAPGVIDRQPVREPMHTGIKVIDALLPLGRGQRELILGDRATGKTSLALDAILAQRDSDVVCVYAAIGLRKTNVAEVVETLRVHDVLAQTVIVVGRRRFAARPAVPRPLHRVHDRRVVHASGPARAGRLRQPDQRTPTPTAGLRSCWDGRRAARPIRRTSSICTPGCWSGPRGCTTDWAAAA